ncbi:MAG: serine protease [Sedimentitalea sp.]
MRFLLALFVSVLTIHAASAQSLLDREVPLEKLKPGETRFLQALMAAEGSYEGLIDGDWGGRSLTAFRAIVQRKLGTSDATIGDLAQLSAPFLHALERGRWTPFHDQSANMSFQVPMGLMTRQPGNDVAFAARDQSIVIQVQVGTPEDAQQLHQAAMAQALSSDQVLRITRPDLRVTSTRLRDGVNSVYVRSQDRGKRVATTLVQWRPLRGAEARLVVASITKGKQRALELPEGGLINRAIQTAQDVAQSQVTPNNPKPQNDVETTKQSGAFAGTAFYINHSDLATSAWVLAVCDKGLRLQDGTQLAPLDIARALDLVVMTSPRRSSHWLPLGAAKIPPLSAPMVSVGYPFFDRSFRGLSETRGRLEGRGGNENSTQLLAMVMPRKSGNMGAPVLDASGSVVGIVVRRAAKDREPLPDRVTLAAPAQVFSGFLTRNGILHDTRAAPAQGIEPLTRSDRGQAIVPVFCR